MKKAIYTWGLIVLLSMTSSNSIPQENYSINSKQNSKEDIFSKNSTKTNQLNFQPAGIQMIPIVSGLNDPIVITHAGDSSGRIFIAEREGFIRIFNNGSLKATPFLDMHSIVNSIADERGLLALTFHPQYETNGFFYTVHTNSSGALVLSRFTTLPANSNQADFGSRLELLSIPHPGYSNHNGGTLAFGADGYLYWSTGDGGGGGDPDDNAQDLTSLLGKILRLDVNVNLPTLYTIPTTNPFYNSPPLRGEIWAYGLRNPWRFSFDRLTQDIYIADVGQGNREEINFQDSSSVGGENYGWDIIEGSICYNATTCNQNNKVLPITEYDHGVGCSVTGGYVYRGVEYPDLQGNYFYADFCSGRFFSLSYSSGIGDWVNDELIDTSYLISTFGEDESGELYFASYSEGRIYQVTYQDPPTFVDVPFTHPHWNDIEILYANGLTAGCNTSPLMFCPDMNLNRAQMAVFTLRGEFGTSYAPPSPPWSSFNDDFSAGLWAQPWAQGMYNTGLTAGCSVSPLLFCPWQQTPREQAAVFGLRLSHGNTYAPPNATGAVFADMTNIDYWSTPWVEQAYLEGIIPACGTDITSGKPLFCPDNLIDRGWAAYLIVQAKNLTMP